MGYLAAANVAKNTLIVDNLTARQITIHGSFSNGGTHACVIKTDNTSVCWGENSVGQLGDNTTTDCGAGSSPTYQKTACTVPIFDDNSAQGNLKKVAAGSKFTLWLDNSGKVYSAGECSSGRLGNGCTDNNTKIATTVMTGVKDIEVANTRSCALKTDNTLHCWGGNSSNNLTFAHNNNVETPLQIGINVNKFAVGGYYVAMIHDNNTVFCTDNWYQDGIALCNTKLTL